MYQRVYQLGLAALASAVLVVFPNCTPAPGIRIDGTATGGGTIAKAPGGSAHFGFNGSSCGGTIKGNFNYNDKSPAATTAYGKQGVMLKGDITAIVQCIDPAGCFSSGLGTCPTGGYIIGFTYDSNNPNQPGTGTGGACLVDGGEGKAAPSDQVAVGFDSGPYSGYSTSGAVSGNVQGHLCD